jgi:hypothetical protein
VKRFCTSGPVDKETCYYVNREDIMEEALEKIESWRYFTVSAPRQTGKTTFLRDVVERVKDRYLTIFISFEGIGNVDNEKDFCNYFQRKITFYLKKIYKMEDKELIGLKNVDKINKIDEYIVALSKLKNRELILMIDEFERFKNNELMNDFLHVIRSMYHDKKDYELRSVVLISVNYLMGILSDNASPFNIVEHIEVPYFTREQVYDLLSQHERESDQIFDPEVKELIWHNAAGQPGLTNALAADLVEKKAKGKSVVKVEDIERTLDDFMRKYIDKNVENIVSKAKQEKELIMKILFEPDSVEFNISDERIKFLYLNGVIGECNGKCCVKVPLYYKKLYKHFKPEINGETNNMKPFGETVKNYIDKNGNLDLNKLLNRYVKYVKERGGIMFKGRNYYEGVYQYNLDQFLSVYVEAVDGKVYPETQVGGGRIDLLVNLNNREYLIEVKANIDSDEYEKGKRQLVEYLKRKSLKEGWLIVYSNQIDDFEYKKEDYEDKILHIWFIKTKFEAPSKYN